MSKTSKEAYKQVAGYINQQQKKAVRLHRDKTNTIELDQVRADAEAALTWLGVLVKYVETLETAQGPQYQTLFDVEEFTEDYSVGKGVRVASY